MGSLRVERRSGGCIMLVLENERRKNALDLAMLRALQESLAALAADNECRLVALRGQGENFCAGRDISELGGAEEPPADGALRPDFELLGDLATRLYHFPKPTLAVVRGYALGLGAALVALCDLAIAEEGARFGIPEAKVGVPPSLTTVALLQVVAPKAAARILFTGAPIGAREAQRIGLITEAVADGDLEAACETLVGALLEASPTAVQLCKGLMRATEAQGFPGSVEQALRMAMRGLGTEDAIEGRRAFLEKRRPVWSKREPTS